MPYVWGQNYRPVNNPGHIIAIFTITMGVSVSCHRPYGQPERRRLLTKCQDAPLRFIKGKESIEEGEVVAEKLNPMPAGGGFEKVDSKKAGLLSRSIVQLQTGDFLSAPLDEIACCEGHFYST